jgi:hypothetical protein
VHVLIKLEKDLAVADEVVVGNVAGKCLQPCQSQLPDGGQRWGSVLTWRMRLPKEYISLALEALGAGPSSITRYSSGAFHLTAPLIDELCKRVSSPAEVAVKR